jgi:diguanylate cyclase (GGDEF)-like protein/PAS domain S-box-containing protein
MLKHDLMTLAFGVNVLADESAESGPPSGFAGPVKERSRVARLTDGRSIAISIGPMPDGGDVFTFEDITARTSLDEALRQSEERLALATKSARIGIWDYDVVANKLVWDARMYELYGIRGEDFSGAYDAWQAALHPEDRARGDRAISDAISGTRDLDIEFRVLWPNGEEHDIEAHALARGPEHGPATRMIGVNWDITGRKQAENRIVRLARYDDLTGLPNRSVFVEALTRLIAQSRRDSTRFAVLYLDLDHFKDVNDVLGHPVGDLLLKIVAERLRANIRETDMVARFGGDEFAVLLSDIGTPVNATLVSDRLLRSIAGQIDVTREMATIAADVAEKIVASMSEVVTIDANRIHTGASVGIAVYGSDSPDAEAMLSYADVALYRAKAERRGGYCFFTDGMDAEVRARINLSAELREAMVSDQLFLVYQPQVDTDTSLIIGLEALVRWRHPTLGVLGPGKFIPEAERTGLIVPLGRWVLREACQQARRWADANILPPKIAINISGVQFKLPFELEMDIAASVAEAGLSPKVLELELTESVLMGVTRDHSDLLLRLRNEGYHIAIDDFGSGYSSLDYLRRYPVDRIKIAQKFISEIGIESGSDAIVRAALGLARELNLDVIVEGVETAAQLALLREWGARTIQGYYYSRPLPVAEVTRMLGIGRIRPCDAGGSA